MKHQARKSLRFDQDMVLLGVLRSRNWRGGRFLRTGMIDKVSIMPHRDVEAPSQRPRLIILSTGGTIAMTTQTAQGGAAMTLCAANLVGAVPRLTDLAEIEGRDVLAKPNADFTLADIVAIADAAMAAAKTGAGIVITHGTDTLEESAFALSLLVQVEVPIVFTAAMRRPDQPGADGQANLLAASWVAISLATRGKGLPRRGDRSHRTRAHLRQCAGCPQGADHPATAAIRSSGSGPGQHHLQSFLKRRSAGEKLDLWSRFFLLRPFQATWQDIATSGAVITSTPRGRAIFSRACLSESKDNGYNCCTPIRMFSGAPAAKRQVTDAVSVVQAHPQSLTGFADNPFIGQSLIFPASAFFYTWGINWTTCPS
jgi:hypothetical protein